MLPGILKILGQRGLAVYCVYHPGMFLCVARDTRTEGSSCLLCIPLWDVLCVSPGIVKILGQRGLAVYCVYHPRMFLG